MTKKLVLHSSFVEKEWVLFLCIQNELKERYERWRDAKKREVRKEERPALSRSVQEQSRESRRRGELNNCY